MISLIIQPGITRTWKQFLEETPPFSVALDGYVSEGPIYADDPPRMNFNHHEGCYRDATRATCAQVLMAIRRGFFDTFRDAVVHVNDCDEDVCTSCFLLKHGYLAGATMNPLLNRLVSMEDSLDSAAGAYPFPVDLPSLREFAWVYQPYRLFRKNGGIERNRKEEYLDVIENVEYRIMKHIMGAGYKIDLELRYEVTHHGQGWSMVVEDGAQARTAMLADGIKAFVSVRERVDGRWTYTIGRMSPYVRFDVIRILAELNDCEGIVKGPRWGGGNTIGGSPRGVGSKLSPAEVAGIISNVVNMKS